MIQLKKYLLLITAFLLLGSVALAQKKSKKQKSEKADTTAQVDQIKSLTREALFINAMQSKVLGNYNEAIFRFNSLLKEEPNNHAAHFQLAQLYFYQNQLDKAEAENQTALRLNPDDEWYYIFLGQIKAERGDLSGAADIYKQLIAIKPNETELYYDWAMLLEEAGRTEEALGVYDQLEKKMGFHEEIFVRKLPLYQLTKQTDRAIRDVNKLISADSGQFRYYGYLGDLYEQKGEHDKAVAAFQRILSLDPGNILGYYSISETYAKKGDEINRRKVLSEAISSGEISVEDKVRLILPIIQTQLGEDSTEGSKKLIYDLLDIMEKAHPEDQTVLGLVAESYYTFGETEKAVLFLKEIVKDTSSTKETYIQLLSILSELERYEELNQYARSGGTRFPEDPAFDFFTAFSAMLTKKYSDAKTAYQEGLKKQFSNEALRLQMLAGLGDVSSELKDFDTADNSYEKALEIDPNNATVLNNYAYYLSVRNIELDRAERMSRKSNLLEENNAAFQDTYAWIQYQKGAYSEALKWMEKAIISAADHPSAEMYDHYGDILFKLDRKSDALKYWKKALEIDQTRQETAEKISKTK